MRYFALVILLFLISITSFLPVSLNEYNKTKISIEVKGCVMEEQILSFDTNTTIQQALDTIDLKDNADLSSINRQLVLLDKDVLVIPCEPEVALISINTATVQQLDTLPGIGLATAQRIVDYRNEHGLFQSIEQIQEVEGIKEAKFNAIKDLICL